MNFDVAILGGGPAGSTCGTLLKKYRPDLSVVILERERFPRDHIGESQLPMIGAVLDEMGVWDKVEAANFPIKIGATYRWGLTPDLWNFEFIPNGRLEPEPRPAQHKGQRLQTAFQVDRAVYDKILLDHAMENGCQVREETKVAKVEAEGDRVTGLVLESGERLTARYYVDATGNSALIRRTMGVEVEAPTTLRNIAVWDYFQNADWAVEIGVGGTRIQIMSLGYGWIWFIPLGPTRTSVGLVLPAEHYKQSGLKIAELFEKALQEEPRIRELMRNATPEGNLQTTNDWSYVADRLAGENWLMAGDCCGFADPILSAGMTLAHSSAREVAYTILELDRGELDGDWLRQSYTELHTKRIRQHIRFADYWYSANAQFSDLKEFTAEIAKDAGLDLDPDKAFQWLGTGGFANDDLGVASIGTFELTAIKQITQLFSGTDSSWQLNRYNEFRLDMAGVKTETRPLYQNGRIESVKAYVRGPKVLPLLHPFLEVVSAVQRHKDLKSIIGYLDRQIPGKNIDDKREGMTTLFSALEALLAEGWIKGSMDKKQPTLGMTLATENLHIYFEKELAHTVT
jgi:flavin-dependent dehydrogenase